MLSLLDSSLSRTQYFIPIHDTSVIPSFNQTINSSFNHLALANLTKIAKVGFLVTLHVRTVQLDYHSKISNHLLHFIFLVHSNDRGIQSSLLKYSEYFDPFIFNGSYDWNHSDN
jgi:hypothetical protein